ncbi:MAG TPA: diaminobutyrate--2-oxoglutarate transaminase family protein [Arenibaculum sp.]|nr:diaminobutyrate--2-oxoglutarate transaminase family protein [Arenibaculum sp.]
MTVLSKPGSYPKPNVTTPVPGPRSSEYLQRQRDDESGAVSYPRRLPIAVRRASGSYIEDWDGNVYLDFLTGAGVLPLGHGHPEIIAAAAEQMKVFCHGLDLPSDVKDRFREAQLAMLPGGLGRDMRVHFCGSTGADAVEAAIKLAKIHTKGDEIISFQGGYHGSTHAALAVTADRTVKSQLGNLMPGVHFFPYSSCSDCPIGLSRPSCRTNCILFLEKALRDSHSGLRRPAGVILELVQGEGGVNPADPEFVRRLRAITAEFGIPLIVDEIQTGCGRTGTWFAFERYGIEPDMILASKGLSGMGSPVSLLFYRRHLDAWGPGTHIGTFRGNHVAFAAGIKLLEIMERDHILDNARATGTRLRDGLEVIKARTPLVSDVRGIGLMLGIELRDPETGRYATQAARAVQRAALERGLILEVGGRDDAVVRLLPPLNLTMDEVDSALAILTEAVSAAVSAAGEAPVAPAA